MKSRREIERAQRGKARASFWEQQREEEERQKQAAEAKMNETAVEWVEGGGAKKRGLSGSSATYSFDQRSNWVLLMDIRKADLRDALDLCRYQVARRSDPRIIAGSIRRAEMCFQACISAPKQQIRGKDGSLAPDLLVASQHILRFKHILQRLRDGESATASPQDPTLSSTHDPPRPSTPPLTSAGAPVPRPQTPPLSAHRSDHTGLDFPPYVKPPDAATERARNAMILRLKNLGVPRDIQEQLTLDEMEKQRQEITRSRRDYRTVDELPDNDLEYTM